MNEKYLQLQLEELITDESYIEWVLKGENDAKWQDWCNANPSFNQIDKDARRLLGLLKFKEEAFTNEQKEVLWKRIEHSTATKVITMPKRTVWIRRMTIAAVAAVLLIFIISRFTFSTVQYQSGDSIRSLTLPGQSTVELKPNSQIKYEPKSWKEERLVQLDGEAFFDVVKGVPFRVTTENGEVRVLGTRFTVNSGDESFLVIVESGRVEVTSGNRVRILEPGMAFSLNGDMDRTSQAWDSQIIEEIYYQFEEERLDMIMAILNNQYGLNFRGEYDGSRLYSGGFTSTDSIEDILYTIFWPLDISYVIDGSTVSLTTK